MNVALQDESTVQEVAIDLIFLFPLQKEYRCLMCEQLMRDPCHLTCCQSRYCQKCVERLIASKHRCMNTKCQSKTYRKEVSREDEEMANMITTLQVYCPMKIRGCGWAGRIRDLEAHLRWGEFDHDDTAGCRFLPVACPEQCGEMVPRRNMEEHCQMECGKRHIKCQYCGYEDVATVITTMHRPSCRLRVVDCPNGCGMPGINNTGLSHHLKEECPLQLVSCEHIGCGEQFCFKDRTEHNKLRFHEHFHLMSEKVVALSRENDELRSLALSVQSTCNTLQEQYRALLELLIHREEDDYLSMTGVCTFSSAPSPPPVPARDDKPDEPPTIHSRTDSMRDAVASFSENSAPDLLLRRKPVSYLPPRFSELVASSETSSPDFTDLSSWNVLPLPPRSSKVLDVPPPPPMDSPSPELPMVSPPQQRPSMVSPPEISSPPEHPPVVSSPPEYPPPEYSPAVSSPPVVSPRRHPPSPPQLPPQPMPSPLPPPRPPPPPVLSPSPSPSVEGVLKRIPPPPPPRRDSLSSVSFRRRDRSVSIPVQHKPRNSFHISLPNLVQDEEGDYYQYRPRTWSNTSAVKDPAYSRNGSISQRYETSGGFDQVSIDSDDTANTPNSDYESQFNESYESALKYEADDAPSNLPSFRRLCKSVDIGCGGINMLGSPLNLQASKSSECLYVNKFERSDSSYVNTHIIGKLQATKGGSFRKSKARSKTESMGGRRVVERNDSDFVCDPNPVYIKSPVASISHRSDISHVHHTLLINEQ